MKMANAEAFAKLQQHIEALRHLGSVGDDIAPVVAEELRSELEANITRGVGPDGKKWPPTKAGEQPLRGAARALKVTAHGTVVLAVLEGPEARHHLGSANGGVVRRILPSRHSIDFLTRIAQRVGLRIIAARLQGD